MVFNIVRRLVIVGTFALACVGCTHTSGRDFVRPGAANYVLGETTKTAILGIYGSPEREATAITSGDDQAAKQVRSEFDPAPVAGSYSTITYHYSENTPPIVGGNSSVRSVAFTFLDNKLVAYNFVSNFIKDSTDFDESKLSSLEKHKTTETQVEQLLGAPTGRATYPVVLTPGNKKVLYSYVTQNKATRKIENKALTVIFGPDDRIVDYRFNSGAVDAPAPTGGSAGVIPIVIPVRK